MAGCSSAPFRMSNVTEGNWTGRALVKDKEHSRSFIVVLDFNAVKNESIRVDVSSTLGQHLATFVLNGTEVSYYTSDSKRFYTGSPRPEALKPILTIPLDPRWLQNVLWDEPIVARNWSCTDGDDKLVAQCKEKTKDLTIAWANRKGSNKSVDISHPKGEIQINLHSFTPKVESREGLFALEPPQGYQKVRLR